jgi:hypothetical protein
MAGGGGGGGGGGCGGGHGRSVDSRCRPRGGRCAPRWIWGPSGGPMIGPEAVSSRVDQRQAGSGVRQHRRLRLEEASCEQLAV